MPAAFGGQADFPNQQSSSQPPQPSITIVTSIRWTSTAFSDQLLSGGYGGAQTEGRDEQRVLGRV